MDCKFRVVSLPILQLVSDELNPAGSLTYLIPTVNSSSSFMPAIAALLKLDRSMRDTQYMTCEWVGSVITPRFLTAVQSRDFAVSTNSDNSDQSSI